LALTWPNKQIFIEKDFSSTLKMLPKCKNVYKYSNSFFVAAFSFTLYKLLVFQLYSTSLAMFFNSRQAKKKP